MTTLWNQKNSQIEGQVAIVTGGSVGIGYATCMALAREGANVVVVGRNRDRLAHSLRELKRQRGDNGTLGLALDVTQEKDMAQMAERTLEKFGRIDILIGTAGILRTGGGFLRTLQAMPVEEWDAVIDTNLKGIFLSNRAVLPAMIRQGRGNIVNVSSTSGRKGLAYDSAYCASKFGIIGLSEALAEEVGQYGVRVQVLLPGAIETDMWDQNGPLPRPRSILSSERVADLILHLVSLADDVMLATPIIEPIKTQVRTEWINHSRSDKAWFNQQRVSEQNLKREMGKKNKEGEIETWEH
jgi:NAD(P)-dependent dehydrogenase (short-subunit alcohol dehydrogenase family)